MTPLIHIFGWFLLTCASLAIVNVWRTFSTTHFELFTQEHKYTFSWQFTIRYKLGILGSVAMTIGAVLSGLNKFPVLFYIPLVVAAITLLFSMLGRYPEPPA